MTEPNADPLLALLLDSLLDSGSAEGCVQPRPDLRADLLAATAGSQHRFPGFRRRLARLFDLSDNAAEHVLGQLGTEAAWVPIKTLLVHHFAPGPACGAAHAGLVRCPPGLPFPLHRHRGCETTLFLSGAVRDEDTGELLLPGDLVTRSAGSLHRLTVLPPHECIFAVLLQGELPDFDPQECD